MASRVWHAHEMLHAGTGVGAEYTGWIQWPKTYNREEYERIRRVGVEIREKAEAFIVIGVGGSYLGAKAAMDMLLPAFYIEKIL